VLRLVWMSRIWVNTSRLHNPTSSIRALRSIFLLHLRLVAHMEGRPTVRPRQANEAASILRWEDLRRSQSFRLPCRLHRLYQLHLLHQ
jgi:hypothetical protein